MKVNEGIDNRANECPVQNDVIRENEERLLCPQLIQAEPCSTLYGCSLRPRLLGGRKTSLDPHPKDMSVSRMQFLGQPKVIAAAKNEGSAAAVALRRRDAEGQISTL